MKPFQNVPVLRPKLSKTRQREEAKNRAYRGQKAEQRAHASQVEQERRSLEKVVKHLRKQPLEQRAQEILDVLRYRDGDFYVGGMAFQQMASMLGVHGYDEMGLRVEKAIRLGANGKIAEVWRYLESYITHMKKHPLVTCPHCGHTKAGR